MSLLGVKTINQRKEIMEIRTAIKLTSAMNQATITIDRDDIRVLQDVTKDNNNGSTKVFTPYGNFYVDEKHSQVAELAFGDANLN